MTAVECFLDTNILLYAASRNPADLTKKKIAVDLIGEKEFGLSAQVLQEFYTVATKKADFRMPPEKALEWIENFEEFPCAAIDTGLVKTAAETSARYRISYWDGAIVAAAEALGAPILYSEDLNDGQAYGGVRVVNPFREQARRPLQGFQEDNCATNLRAPCAKVNAGFAHKTARKQKVRAAPSIPIKGTPL